MEQKDLETSMNLIIHAGNAKSSAMEAISLIKKGKAEECALKMKEADQEIAEAHKAQTQLLTKEANGEVTPFSLLLVHSQDHLMTAITFLDLAREVIDIYKHL